MSIPGGPYSGYSIFQLPVQADPALDDSVPLAHYADGNTYQVTLEALAALIGGGGGPFIPALTSDFTVLTVYNYCATPYGALPTGTAATNNTAMTKMFAAMSAANPKGGLAFIPQFNFAVTAGNFTCPVGMNMVGSGTGGRASGSPAPPSSYHFNVAGDGTLFNCAGGHTSGGQYFRSLGISFSSATLATTTAIYAGTWNAIAEDCTFTNVPIAFNAQGLSSGLKGCTISYESGINGVGPGGAGAFAAVNLGGPQSFFVGPGEIEQKSQADGGPSGTVCIAITSGAEHAVIADLHISHWSYGISYNFGGSTVNAHITNVEFACWNTAVYMQPASSIGTIAGDVYTGCSFLMGNESNEASDNVYIDTNGGANNNVTDINFNGCTSYQAGQHGYNISTGSNIQITGGTSSGNGLYATGAGVAITGNCGDVTVTGVNLNAKYPGSPSYPNHAQAYAFLCSGSPSASIRLDGCDMSSGYSGSPIDVSGTPTNLVITNCPGYNDQLTAINTISNVPSGSGQYAANQGSSGGVNYYGPSRVTLVNGSGGAASLHLAGGPFSIPANGFASFYLANPYEPWYIASGTLATLAWIGL